MTPSRPSSVSAIPTPRVRWWRQWAWWAVTLPGGVLLLTADRLSRPVPGPYTAPLVLVLLGSLVVAMLHALRHLMGKTELFLDLPPEDRLSALAAAVEDEWAWRVQGTVAFTALVVGVGGAAAGDAATSYLAWHALWRQDAALEIPVFAVSAALLLYLLGDLADLVAQGPPRVISPVLVPPSGSAVPTGASGSAHASGPVDRPRGASPL